MAHSVMGKRKRKYLWAIPILLLLIYFAGPRPSAPQLPSEIEVPQISLDALDRGIRERESQVPGLKPDNESRIIWYGEKFQKTPYVLLYLHGWSASYMEGDPVHRSIAQRYGANLYLPRLDGHGIDLGDNTFADITASSLMQSAANALGEAHLLGDSVIIVGTSTGGTLGLYLAGIDPLISSLVLYSPNVKIYDKSAALLDDPWGLQIGKLVTGSKYHGWEATGPRKQYWTTHYQLRGLSELQALVSNTMIPETFENVKQPIMVAYYYKNDSLQDMTVSVDAIQEMFPQIGSGRKRLVVVPEAGHHVMASSLTSNDLETVEQETISFLEEEVGISPVLPDSVEAESM